jgi:hypothetical protein
VLGWTTNDTRVFVLKVFGTGGDKNTLIGNNTIKNATDAKVNITGINILGPDYGEGTEYTISFFNSEGTQIGEDWNSKTSPGKNTPGSNTSIQQGYPSGKGPKFDMTGGSIMIRVNLSFYSSNFGYDPCWNVGIGYSLTTWYK